MPIRSFSFAAFGTSRFAGDDKSMSCVRTRDFNRKGYGTSENLGPSERAVAARTPHCSQSDSQTCCGTPQSTVKMEIRMPVGVLDVISARSDSRFHILYFLFLITLQHTYDQITKYRFISVLPPSRRQRPSSRPSLNQFLSMWKRIPSGSQRCLRRSPLNWTHY
jgi:hypothetical protein